LGRIHSEMLLRGYLEERLEGVSLSSDQLPAPVGDHSAAGGPCLQATTAFVLRAPAFEHAECCPQPPHQLHGMPAMAGALERGVDEYRLAAGQELFGLLE
jgi:hypothetical protein